MGPIRRQLLDYGGRRSRLRRATLSTTASCTDATETGLTRTREEAFDHAGAMSNGLYRSTDDLGLVEHSGNYGKFGATFLYNPTRNVRRSQDWPRLTPKRELRPVSRIGFCK